VYIGSFRKPYTVQEVGGEWNVKDLIGRTMEEAAIQLVVSDKIFYGPRKGLPNTLSGCPSQLTPEKLSGVHHLQKTHTQTDTYRLHHTTHQLIRGPS
jgi:hypothetical protein